MKIEVSGGKHAGRGGGRFGGIGRLRGSVYFVEDGNKVVWTVAGRGGEVELGRGKVGGPLGADPASVHGGGERVAVIGVQVRAPEATVAADA